HTPSCVRASPSFPTRRSSDLSCVLRARTRSSSRKRLRRGDRSQRARHRASATIRSDMRSFVRIAKILCQAHAEKNRHAREFFVRSEERRVGKEGSEG